MANTTILGLPIVNSADVNKTDDYLAIDRASGTTSRINVEELKDSIGVALAYSGTNITPSLGSSTASGTYATISGGRQNTASGYYFGLSTVGGGESNNASGDYSTVSGGRCNSATSSYSTVGGGRQNTASYGATVGGGLSNIASGSYSGILGGQSNHTCGYANSFIIGSNICATASCTTFVNNLCVLGSSNIGVSDPITANRLCVGSGHGATLGTCATIAGGSTNTANCSYSTVSGGSGNTASGGYQGYGTVGGGRQNTASGGHSTVAGGYLNTASSYCSTVGGGYNNTASGASSAILGGKSNNTNSCSDAMIVGSNITANRACTTFVNNLSIMNIPTASSGLPSGAVWSDGGTLKIVS